MIDISKIKTLGDLKKTNYKPRSIKDELRQNMIDALKNNTDPFEGIFGYDETVLPELQTSILSRHNILLLGLRGQAKTRIARLLVNLLDEYIPAVEGSDLNEDPLEPIANETKRRIKELGDETEIRWIHRSERYTEKLATPDVTVSDLIGDVDPIKAATLKLPYSDERVIHFGLIPRSHRSIFVINELPDLQARIQVSLFNILQESDIQIRGFKIRLLLDIQFIFTANPEDYTNRGSIVTPLKDRIDSQIITHYPKSISVSQRITEQESDITDQQNSSVVVSPLVKEIIEQIAVEARSSEYVDEKSGVSARLTISAYENLLSFAERRKIINNEPKAYCRISDIVGVIPAITGKVELVFEGEQEGPAKVANILISKAIKSVFEKNFPSPELLKKRKEQNPYVLITTWFAKNNVVDILSNATNDEYKKVLTSIPGLQKIVEQNKPDADENLSLLYMEFILHGLSEYSQLSKLRLDSGFQFKDMLSSMFSMSDVEELDPEDDPDYFK
ncbi:MAG: AAA family ATPase [Ignavibacteriales bacterium]|nr:AAA family ATPase [Ignavibacteriales bacterium]